MPDNPGGDALYRELQRLKETCDYGLVAEREMELRKENERLIGIIDEYFITGRKAGGP
jgi:hypothetical protein